MISILRSSLIVIQLLVLLASYLTIISVSRAHYVLIIRIISNLYGILASSTITMMEFVRLIVEPTLITIATMFALIHALVPTIFISMAPIISVIVTVPRNTLISALRSIVILLALQVSSLSTIQLILLS